MTPYGNGATFVDLGIDDAPDRAARTYALAEALREAWPAADVIVGAGVVVVVGVGGGEIARVARSAAITRAAGPVRTHAITSVYDGPDLAAVAEALGVAPDEVIARHTEADHLVELVGFLPGFAYLAIPGGSRLAVPRRASPRPRVPAGSIAVAAGFTGIYPLASPGGWSLIGRAIDAVPFDPARDPAALFAPGDRVRFVAVGDEFADARGSSALADARGSVERDDVVTGLVVIAAPACATVQDRGRAGQLGRGIPPSGPLDVETFAAANVAVGNRAGAAAIEVPLGALEVEARGLEVLVSIDGQPAIRLHDGERLRVPEGARAVRYLAVRGGVAVPEVLGARATLLAAGLGGHLGRTLRRRDLLPIGDEEGAELEPAQPGPIGSEEALAIDPGPHVERFPPDAYEVLLGTSWRVSRLGDRVGVRLEGGRVPREGPDRALPVPMLRGAVEITTDGTPIVLGPDHPTTGGYPVLAVLRASAQAALARKRPGEAVRFRSA